MMGDSSDNQDSKRLLPGRKRQRLSVAAQILSTALVVGLGALLLAVFQGRNFKAGLFSGTTSNNNSNRHLAIKHIDKRVLESDWPPSSIVDAVADDQNRVAIVSLNCQHLQFADNWAQSLLSLSVKNFILVPLDKSTETVLQAAYPEHTVPLLPGLDATEYESYAEFGTDHFKDLTATRPTILRAFADKGYTILYNDADMVWKANVWNDLDKLKEDKEAIFLKDGAEFCSCMIYMDNTHSNQRLLQMWQEKVYTGKFPHDQNAFSYVINNMDHGVRWKFGPPNLFPAGLRYFFAGEGDEFREGVHLVHANWMKGLATKYVKLRDSGNWNPSGKLVDKLPSCAKGVPQMQL